MDASPIYAFAVGDSQTLFHTSVWLRVSAKRFLWFPMGPLKSKKTEPDTRCFSDVRLRRVIHDFNMSACRGFVQSSATLQELSYHVSAVAINTDRLLFDLHRAVCFIEIQAGINCLRIIIRHLPERIFADNRCVHSDPDLQEEHMQPFVPAEEIRIGSAGPVPAFILYKGIVSAEIHCHI